MLNLKSYQQKDLQHFMQMLNQCESAGITDIRFAREELHRHIYKPQKLRAPRRKFVPADPRCPECDGYMFPARGEKRGTFMEIDGKTVLVCIKCRYSEVAR